MNKSRLIRFPTVLAENMVWLVIIAAWKLVPIMIPQPMFSFVRWHWYAANIGFVGDPASPLEQLPIWTIATDLLLAATKGALYLGVHD